MPRSFDSSSMMSSLAGADTRDAVFSIVSAQINPNFRRQLENFEDVFDDIEQETGVEIKFSRKNYCFVGGWNQINKAKHMLELYAANYTPSNTNSSDPDQELKSFEVINGSISRIKGWQYSQEKQNNTEGMGQAAEDQSVKHHFDFDHKQEEIASMSKKKQPGGDEKFHPAGEVQSSEQDFKERSYSVKSQESVGSEQREPPDYAKILDGAEDQMLPVDADVLEYMEMTGRLQELKRQHHIDFVVNKNIDENKESEHIFVTLVAENENPPNLTQMFLAKEAFLGEYQEVLQSCTKEVCQFDQPIDECAEKAHAECLISYPDILVKALSTERNTYVFIGQAGRVKKCRHLFMTCVTRYSKKDGYPHERSKIAANFNQDLHLQGNNPLQCEEARAILATATNTEQLIMQQGSSGNEETVTVDIDPDMPDLESYAPVADHQTDAGQQHSLIMAGTPASDLKNKDDLTKMRTTQQSKQTCKTLIQLFDSSDDDDDDDRVPVASREPESSIVKDEECLKFPDQWLISLDEPEICLQCTESVRQLVHLGCGHKFCRTCIKNKSRMADMCPECGKGFSRDEFHQLEAELTAKHERKQGTKDVPAAKMVETYRNGKLEFKPEMQEDGTFVQSSTGKLCEQCTDPFMYLIPLECRHELCVSCYRNLSSPPKCPSCETTVKKVNLSPPKCEISHNMDKKTPLPHFPKQGSITVNFIVEEGNDKDVQYTATSFKTYLPNNSDGRNLFKLFLDARKRKKLFEVLPTNSGQGMVLPVNGLTLKTDPTAIDKDYLSALEKTLHQILKEK